MELKYEKKTLFSEQSFPLSGTQTIATHRSTSPDLSIGKSMFNWYTWPETIFDRIVECLVIAAR